eukprot:143100-Amphidinium_carterae.2
MTTEQIEWTSEITSTPDNEHEGSRLRSRCAGSGRLLRNLIIDNEQGDLNAFKRQYEKGNGNYTKGRKGLMPQEESYGGRTKKYTNMRGRQYQVKGKRKGYSIYNSGASYASYSNTYCRASPDHYSHNKEKVERAKAKVKKHPIPQQQGD